MKNERQEKGGPANPAAGGDSGRRWRFFWAGLSLLVLLFSPCLLAWVRFAWSDELSSYVLLVPVISGYLIWQRRVDRVPIVGGSIPPAIVAAGLAVVFAGLAWMLFGRGPEAARHDYLAPATLAFFFAGLSWALLRLGPAVIRHHAFAILFFIFAAPLPSWAVNGLEIFFQHTSAEVASWLIHLTGMPMLRSGLVFQLPGFTMQVAQECSGIRSSLVLFIVSILAGHVILTRRWSRLALALFVIPLGIVRNAIRILTIALLCVHVDTRMIDSPIHHRGGPIFFALSLVPLFFFVLWLRRVEGRRSGLKEPARTLPGKAGEDGECASA